MVAPNVKEFESKPIETMVGANFDGKGELDFAAAGISFRLVSPTTLGSVLLIGITTFVLGLVNLLGVCRFILSDELRQVSGSGTEYSNGRNEVGCRTSAFSHPSPPD